MGNSLVELLIHVLTSLVEPKLKDFLSSRAKPKFSHDRRPEPDCTIIEEIDITEPDFLEQVEEEEEKEDVISEQEEEILEENDVDENSDEDVEEHGVEEEEEMEEDNEEDDDDEEGYCSFSQSSSSTTGTWSDGPKPVMIYDDELKETEEDDDGDGVSTTTEESLVDSQGSEGPKNTFKAGWEAVFDRLKRKADEERERVEEDERTARKFIAKISPTDNTSAEVELKKQLTKDMFSEVNF